MENYIVTEYEKSNMEKLGFTYDAQLDMFFLENSLFIRNVPDDINDIDEILYGEVKEIPSDVCDQLYQMSTLGFQFAIGKGGVDANGVQQNKGLYLRIIKK